MKLAIAMWLLVAAALPAASTAAPVAGHKPVTAGFYRDKQIGYFDFGPI